MKAYLLDINGLAHRFYWSVPRLINGNRDYSVLYALASTIISIAQEEQPEILLGFVDSPKSRAKRTAIYPEYKANRKPTEPELLEQLKELPSFIESLGVRCLSSGEYEADDWIASYARLISGCGKVVIVSGDKDFYQLVSDKITIFNPIKKSFMGPREVVESFGVEPKHVAQKLAMMGDAADNVPGIPGVGDVTSTKIINDGLHTVAKKFEGILNKHFETYELSLKLVSFLDIWEEFEQPSVKSLIHEYNYSKLNDGLRSCGFDNLQVNCEIEI